jgi:hypothetical protein
VTFADQLVSRFAPWLNDDLETYLRAIASMFAETELYAFDWETDEDAGEGWTRLFDPALAPVEALPYLAQVVGETLPVGLGEQASRDWVQDAPNQRRGTAGAVFVAAQRHLTDTKLVTLRERFGSVDTVQIVTYTAQTPSPATTLADILTQLPADVILDYQTLAGQQWQDVKTNRVNWQAVKTAWVSWGNVATGAAGTGSWTPS